MFNGQQWRAAIGSLQSPTKGTIVGLHRQSIVEGSLPRQESQFTNLVSDWSSLPSNFYLRQAHDWRGEKSWNRNFHHCLMIFSPQITNVAQQGEIERVKDVLLQVASLFFFTLNFGIFIMRRFEKTRLC